MRLARTLAALFGGASVAVLAAAGPALATVQYNSDAPGTGWDAQTSPSILTGYTQVSGIWRISSAPPKISSHTNAVYDSAQASGDVIINTSILALADMEVTGTQIGTASGTTGSGGTVGVFLRANSANTSGYLILPAMQSGSLNLLVYRRSGSAYTQIGANGASAPAVYNTGVTYTNTAGAQLPFNHRFAIVGAAIYAKAWLIGSPEPSAWALTIIDTTSPISGTGYTGFYNDLSLAADYGSITDLAVNDNPASESTGILTLAPGAVGAGATVTGSYSGAVPTGINLALDGSSSFTATTGFTASGGALKFTLPSVANGYHQLTAQAANATTETSATPAFYVGLTMGAITATPGPGSVTLATSSAVGGGSGSGFGYSIYRGADPNFTLGTPYATVTSLPWSDPAPLIGQQAYYGVVGFDGAGDTINALPAGVSALADNPTQLLYASAQAFPAQSPAIVFAPGDSITYGATTANPGSSTTSTAPYYAGQKLQKLLGLRSVAIANAGVSGSNTYNWCPGGIYWNNAIANNGTSSAAILFTANPNAKQVFNAMLGTNDSSLSYTQGPCGGTTYTGQLLNADYINNIEVETDAIIAAWPQATVIWHMSPYYNPSTRNGAVYEQTGLSRLYSYRASLQTAIAAEALKHPGQVYLGDGLAFGWFSTRYLAELTTESGPNGNFNLHPSSSVGSDGVIGTQALGEMWAAADAQALYGVTAGSTVPLRYGPHSPVGSPLIH